MSTDVVRRMTFPRLFPIYQVWRRQFGAERLHYSLLATAPKNDNMAAPDNSGCDFSYSAAACSLHSSHEWSIRTNRLSATFDNDMFTTCNARRYGILLLFNVEFSLLEWSRRIGTETDTILWQFPEVVNLFAQFYLWLGRYLSVNFRSTWHKASNGGKCWSLFLIFCFLFTEHIVAKHRSLASSRIGGRNYWYWTQNWWTKYSYRNSSIFSEITPM